MTKLFTLEKTPDNMVFINQFKRAMRQSKLHVRVFGRGFSFRRDGWHNPPVSKAKSVVVYLLENISAFKYTCPVCGARSA